MKSKIMAISLFGITAGIVGALAVKEIMERENINGTILTVDGGWMGW